MSSREFDIPKREVRPATRQSSERTWHDNEACQLYFNTDYGKWRSTRLSHGMTPKETAQTFAACLLAVLAGNLLLQAFSWCIGHFMKGWW